MIFSGRPSPKGFCVFIGPKEIGMPSLKEKIEFDPGKAIFGLSPAETFALTSVRSLEEYAALQEHLPYMRGQSFFFVNILREKARLIMTVITVEDEEITATYELDPEPLSISPEELLQAGQGSGNHPLPAHLESRIRMAMRFPGCHFFKVPPSGDGI